MVKFTKKIQTFIAKYEREFAATSDSAKQLEELLKSLIRGTSINTHLVTSRAKHPDSLRAKLRRKVYVDPETEVTDRIGGRIITYYRDDVDRIAERLKREFEIDETNSVDKRQLLGLKQFGYRSVHLIARLTPPRASMPEYDSLKGTWFEIQIRSVLEHAWAEIEHEVVYKSGTKYLDDTQRLFNAMAGALEILDGQFLSLRSARTKLIEHYRDGYTQKLDTGEEFDAARLLGFLEASCPSGLSWQKAASSGCAFPEHIEASCVEALKAVGLKSAGDLRSWMKQSKYRSARLTFAALQGIGPTEVSHLAVVVLAVALKDEAVLRTCFPEMLRDPSMVSLLDALADQTRYRRR